MERWSRALVVCALLAGRVLADDVDKARDELESLKKKLAEEASIGWWPIIITVVVSVVLVMVLVPLLVWCFLPRTGAAAGAGPAAKKEAGKAPQRRRARRAKWTLDDPSLKPQEIPFEIREKKDIGTAIANWQRRQGESDSDTDSEETEKKLTPEEIIRRHQQIPREPHVGIFIGVDDPMPNSVSGSGMKHSRCSVDARDMAEEFRKLDYKVFCLQDHSKQSDRAYLPTRMNIAKTIRNLKEGRYDEESRRKRNFDPWQTCMVYVASRVRICKVREGHETLEFMLRQELEPTREGVWIEMTELLNKIADIPQRQTVVMLDVVHTGQDDLEFDPVTGEDMPMRGPRLCMQDIIKRTGKVCGLVDNFRCAVIGCVRPEAMQKEITAEDGTKKRMRHGPMCHFIVNGFQDVEKNDPNREIWANMAKQGTLGMGGFGGGLSEMPAQQPVTVGDLLMCPFHCGDMTVDSTYRFLQRKIRNLTSDPICDPYYCSGSVKMAFAYQRAMRPREAPNTPCYLHECKRAAIVERVLSYLCPADKQQAKPVSVAIVGPPGVGKTSLALAVAWQKEIMHAFHDGQFYFSLRKSLQQHREEGRRPLFEIQMLLGHMACGFEGWYPSEEDGAEFLYRNFMKMRCILVVDDVTDPADVQHLFRGMGVKDAEGQDTVIPADRWRGAITPKTGLLITTTDPKVAAACDYQVEVSHLLPPESKQLCAAAAGLQSTEDLPKVADTLLESCGQLPLFAVMLGVTLRGQPESKWEEALERIGSRSAEEAHSVMPKIVTSALELLPEDELACLKSLAVLPPKRSVVIHALPTLWRQVTEMVVDGQRTLQMDHNKAHAVLARLLDLGVGRLVMEDGDPNRKPDQHAQEAFLLHPLIHDQLRSITSCEHPDKIVLESYISAGSQAGDLVLDASSANMWAHGPWDGYFHTNIAEHIANVQPELTRAMYCNAAWVKHQLDAVRVDKVVADFRRFAWKDGTPQAAIYDALVDATPALRRHPWEVLPQLYGRLCKDTHPQVQQFCIDLIDGSKAATPTDKHFLWLKPLWSVDPFNPATQSAGSECLSVGFYKDFLVSGHEDGSVVLWRLSDGTRYVTLKGHAAGVHGCLTTHDGRLATGSKDEDMERRIRVWNIETGESECMSMLDKPEQMAKPPPSFDLKIQRGRSGFDPTNCEDCDSDVYKNAKDKIVEDTVLIENTEDNDDINCFTFAGWDAATCCTSLTLGAKIHGIQSQEVDGKLLVATADAHGRALLWELQTTETTDPDLDGGKDSEDEEEVDRTLGVD